MRRGTKWAGFERFSLYMMRDEALSCSQPGQDASADVSELLKAPHIRAQLDAIPADKVRAELAEYGAWDAEQLADDEANRARIVWCAACNIREEMSQ